jgi:transposase
MVVEVYPLGHETTYLRASPQRRRARNPGGGIALAGCLHLAPLCQILLASHRGQNAYQIARSLGCNPQTVRNAIHAFNQKGLPQALWQGSKRPHTVHRAFQGPEQAQALRELLHQEPRKFGKGTSLWTLDLAAEVSFEEGLTEERVAAETVRATLARMGVRWERAKRWITSPDPQYARKKGGASD